MQELILYGISHFLCNFQYKRSKNEWIRALFAKEIKPIIIISKPITGFQVIDQLITGFPVVV